jgi:quinol monooxygenase YgiN
VDMLAMISASRAEEGCLEYCYAEDVLEPGLIHVKKISTSREALRDHFAARRLGAGRAARATLQIHDRVVRHRRSRTGLSKARGDSGLCYCISGMEFSKRDREPSPAPLRTKSHDFHR